MKTVKEMEREEQEIITALSKLGQESREHYFRVVKIGCGCFVFLSVIAVVFLSDFWIACVCFGSALGLSLDMMMLGGICICQNINLFLLKAVMIRARQIEEIHEVAIQSGRAAVEMIIKERKKT